MIIKPVDIKLNHIHEHIFELLFDSAGNAYLMANDGKTYQLLIESNDNIICIQDIQFVFHKHNIPLKKLKLSSNPMSLKGKIIKEKEKENEEDEENQNDSDEEDDYKVIRRLYPEDFDFYQDSDEEEVDSEEDEMDEFQFAMPGSCDIRISNSDEYTAIYDTIVYNGSYEKNNVVLKTTYCGTPLPYRLLIFSSGEFIIKKIADSQIVNRLSCNGDGEPYFIQQQKENLLVA